MITGMTGLGPVKLHGKDQRDVEVKTVNHRYLDLAFYLPVGFSSLEDKIQKIVGAQSSGQGHCVSQGHGKAQTNIILNQDAVKRYLELLKAWVRSTASRMI